MLLRGIFAQGFRARDTYSVAVSQTNQAAEDEPGPRN